MNNWEVKELLPEDERRATVLYRHDYISSYDLPYSPNLHTVTLPSKKWLLVVVHDTNGLMAVSAYCEPPVS